MTLEAQIHAVVRLPDNCGTNPVWDDQSWTIDTPDPGLLSVSLLMEPDFLHFFLYCLLFTVPNTHDEERGTSSFKSKNIYMRTPSFANIKKDLGWRWDNLSFQYLDSCYKCDSNYGNIIFSVWYCVRLFDSFVYSSEEIGIDPISGKLLDVYEVLSNHHCIYSQELNNILDAISIICSYIHRINHLISPPICVY